MRRLAFISLIAAALAPLSSAQVYTTVTGTITDAQALPYSNAQVTVQLVPAPPGAAKCGPNAIANSTQFTTDQNGTFTTVLCATSSLAPAGSTWQFQVTLAPGIPAPLGFGPQTFTAAVTVGTSSPQSVSATLSAAAPNLSRLGSATSGVTFLNGLSGSLSILAGTGIGVATGASSITVSNTMTGTANQIVVSGAAISLSPTIILPGSLTVPTGSSILTSGTGTITATALLNTGLNFAYPLYGGGGSPAYTSPTVIEEAGQIGANLCIKKIAGFAETGNNNGVVDGTGYVGSQTCSTNPYVNLTGSDSNITTYVPCEIITTTVGWLIPVTNGVSVEGRCGRNGNSVLIASSAASTYPANTPLFTIGLTGSLNFNDLLTRYRLDCSSAPQFISGSTPLNCSDLYLIGINEHSGVIGVTMKGQDNSTNTVPCVFIGDTAAGSAPGHFDFKNNDVDNCGLNDFIDFFATGAAMGHFSDITLNSTSATNKGVHGLHALDNLGGGQSLNVGEIQRLHAEGLTGYAIYFDQGTFGQVDTADCTGVCGGVFQGNTNYGYIALNLATVSGSANVVNNLNANAVGTLQIPDSVSPQVPLYAQSSKDTRGGPQNGVYHTLAFFSFGLVTDLITTNAVYLPGSTSGTTILAAAATGSPTITLPGTTGILPSYTGTPSGCVSISSGVLTGSGSACASAAPTVQSWQQTTMGSDVAITISTITAVMTRSVTMPSSGCPCRVMLSYSVYTATGSSGGSYSFWINDGTNNMAPVTTAQSNGASGITSASYSGFSTVTYANSANVTFTLDTESVGQSFTVKAAPPQGNGPNSSLQASVMTSN